MEEFFHSWVGAAAVGVLVALLTVGLGLYLFRSGSPREPRAARTARAAGNLSSQSLTAVHGPSQSTSGAVPDPFVWGSHGEKRGATRRAGCPVAVLLSVANEHLDALVVERSLGGVALHLDRELPAETFVKVRAKDATPLVPWVEVDVRTCRRESSHYRLGCRFVAVPPTSVLWTLG